MTDILSLISSIPISYKFAVLSAISWASTTIIIKNYLLKSFDPMEIYVLRMGIGFPLLVILLVFVISVSSFKKASIRNNYFTSIIKKTRQNYTHTFMIAFILSVIAGFTGLYSFWRVLEMNHGSYSVAFVWPMVVLFTTIVSYFFFGENITRIQLIGIGVIMVGLLVINIK